MNTLPANCPKWLSKRILEMGGIISFHDYMDIVLNDPIYGYYGSGKVKIDIKGDFVTSPSLSEDFAFLLSTQIEDWLKQISYEINCNEKLSIVEFGAGDGSLLKGIVNYFLKRDLDFLDKISFKIIEINKGMIKKQKKYLSYFIEKGLDISWLSLDELEDNSLNGIVIAHEVLDTFPVERIIYCNGQVFQECIGIDNENESLLIKQMAITEKIKKRIINLKQHLGINIPPKNVQDGWKTELHVNNSAWLQSIYEKLNKGILTIIDYALEAQKYYSSQRNDGTLIAYKNQKVLKEFLCFPSDCDLTCHICNEILIQDAKNIGFELIGLVKQGEALLALGFAEKLFALQTTFKDDLKEALQRREALLRLVDPICLGNFKWFIFQKSKKDDMKIISKCIS